MQKLRSTHVGDGGIYCPVCSKSDFELVEFDGLGTVVTHTIQAVAPEGFEGS